MNFQEIKSPQELEELWESSFEQRVLVFKHSTRCPVSAWAHNEFEKFLQSNPQVKASRVLVVEDRPTSQYIAEKSGIKHESPQAILIEKGAVSWHASHGELEEKSFQSALSQ